MRFTGGGRRLCRMATVLVGISSIYLAATSQSAFAVEASTCNLVAAPGGSDSNPGTAERPFATIQHLVSALAPGQVGCARGGSYRQDVAFSHGGSASARVTLTSYPGERATLIGRLLLREGANYVTVSNMNLNGNCSCSLPSPTINDTNSIFTGDDITNEHTEVCFVVGSSWGRAKETLIARNRIHDCGILPSDNREHGIYVADADATRIAENVIYKNADRGIQLYPDAQGTVIEHNIIDSNGEGIIFSGASGTASSNTSVKDNLITDATIRHDVESWYPSGNPIGVGNIVEVNCVWGGAQGPIGSAIGFTAIANVTASPGYANATAGDYRVSGTSPCAALLAGTAIPTQPFNASEPTSPPPTEGSSPPPSESSSPPPTESGKGGKGSGGGNGGGNGKNSSATSSVTTASSPAGTPTSGASHSSVAGARSSGSSATAHRHHRRRHHSAAWWRAHRRHRRHHDARAHSHSRRGSNAR